MSEESDALVLKVDASQTASAATKLDDFSASAERAEKATDSLAATSQRAGVNHRKIADDYIAAAVAKSKAVEVEVVGVQKLLDRYDPLSAKLRQLTADFEAMDQAIMHGKTGSASNALLDRTMQSLNSEIAKTKGLMNDAAAGIDRSAFSMQGLGLNTAFAKREVIVMGHEVMQGNFSRVPGSFMVLAEHSNILRLALHPVTLSIVGLVAVAALLGVAMAKGAAEQKEMEQALFKSGNAAGMTRGQMLELAGTMAETGQISLSSSKHIVEALVASGQFGTDSLRAVAGLASEYARQTGTDAKHLTKELEKMFEDPAKGAEHLTKTMGLLSIEQLAYIRNLADAGDKEAAQLELAAALDGKLARNTESVGTLTKAWRFLKTAAGEAWDWMMGLGRQTTPEQAVAAQQAVVDALQARLSMAGRGGLHADPVRGAQLDAAKAELAVLTRNLTTQQEIARVEGERVETNKRGLAAQLAYERTDRGRIEKLVAEQEDNKKNFEAQAKTEENRVKFLAVEKMLTEQIVGIQNKGRGTGGEDGSLAMMKSATDAAIKAKTEFENYGKAITDKVVPAQLRLNELNADPKFLALPGWVRKLTEEKLKEAAAWQIALAAKKEEDERIKSMLAVMATASHQLEKAEQSRIDAEEKAAEATAKQAVALNLHTQQLGMSKSAIDAAKIAQYDANIATEEGRLSTALANDANEKYVEAIEHRIAALKFMRDATKNASDVENAAEQLKAQTKLADDAYKAQQHAAQESARAWQNAGTQIGDALKKAFGTGGSALAGMVQAFTSAQAQQITADQAYAEKRQEITIRGYRTQTDVEDQLLQLRNDHDNQSVARTAGMYGDMAASAADFFDKNSKGYAAMQGVSKAFHAAEVAMQLATVGAKLISGAATMFGQSGWGGFAGVAAMAAVMAGLGYAMSGGGGGGGPSTADLQKQQGTGTVLGDASAKSNSIENALKAIQAIDALGLKFTQDMAASLRSIEAGISNLAVSVVRAGITTGAATADVETGRIGRGGGMLSNRSVFGLPDFTDKMPFAAKIRDWIFGTIEASISNSGIGLSGTLGQMFLKPIIDNVQNYVQGINRFFTVSIKESGGLFGGGGTTNHDEWRDLDPKVLSQVRGLLTNIVDSVEDAAKILGVWTPQLRELLMGIPLDVKLSVEGLKGDELNNAVKAFFSSIADKIAGAAMPNGFDGADFFVEFQRSGEGAFETLIRVASEFDVVSHTLAALGMALPGVSMGTLKFTDTLVELLGGVDKFQQKIGSYLSHYYTPAEQRQITSNALDSEFKSMGMVTPTDLAGFRALMEGIDRTTQAGGALYARMLNIEGTFYDFTTAVDGLDEALKQKTDLQNRLAVAQNAADPLTGKTQHQIDVEALYASALDATNLALMKAVVQQEAQNAAVSAQLERRRSEMALEGQLMEAQGNHLAAVANRRALDIETMNLAEIASYDYKAALQAQIDTQNRVNALISEGNGISIQLMQAEGNVAGALAAQRALDTANMTAEEIHLYNLNQVMKDRIAAISAEKAATEQLTTTMNQIDVLTGKRTQKDIDRAAAWTAALSKEDRAALVLLFHLQDVADAGAIAAKAMSDLATAAGINFKTIADDIQKGLLGQMTGDELGTALADMIVHGVYNAVAGRAAQTISDIIQRNLVDPIMASILNGSSVTAAINATLTQANIDSMIAAATSAVTALKTVFDDPGFKAALTALSSAIKGLGQQFTATAAAAIDSTGNPLPAGGHWDWSSGYGVWVTGSGAGAGTPTPVDNSAQILNDKLSLQMEIFKLLGDAAGMAAVLEQQHVIALAAMDPSLRELQKQLWGLQAAAEAAAKAAELAKTRRQMEIDLQRALGHEEQAVAMERADIIATLTAQWGSAAAELIGIQQQIWAALDAQKLQQATDNWTKTLQDWLRGSKLDQTLSPLTARQRFDTAQQQYVEDLMKAQGGDAGARGRFTGDADSYLREALAMFGRASSQYEAIWRAIQDQTQGLIDQGLSPTAPATLTQVVSVAQEGQRVAQAQAATLIEEIRGLRGEVAAQKQEIRAAADEAFDQRQALLTESERTGRAITDISTKESTGILA